MNRLVSTVHSHSLSKRVLVKKRWTKKLFAGSGRVHLPRPRGGTLLMPT